MSEEVLQSLTEYDEKQITKQTNAKRRSQIERMVSDQSLKNKKNATFNHD